MTAPNPLWYVDRSAGEVTFLLLTAVLVLGILRASLPTLHPALVEGAHVNIAMLAVVFAGLHVLASVLDPFAGLGWVDVLVPFASAYRGAWLGLGVVSAYLYVAAILTSWPARRLPRASWLWIHRLMYGGWLVALLHSFGTGSDARNAVFLLLNLVAVGSALAVFLAVRVAEGFNRHPRWWAGMAVGGLLVVLATALWAATGPLQPGWASSSGTPANLLRSR